MSGFVSDLAKLLRDKSTNGRSHGGIVEIDETKMSTGENGESQNGDKPNCECECISVDLNAISVTIVVHVRNQKFHLRIQHR